MHMYVSAWQGGQPLHQYSSYLPLMTATKNLWLQPWLEQGLSRFLAEYTAWYSRAEHPKVHQDLLELAARRYTAIARKSHQ